MNPLNLLLDYVPNHWKRLYQVCLDDQIYPLCAIFARVKSRLRNKYLSRPRFDRYLNATGSNLSRAKRLYNANLRLAQAFHPLLTQFEVVLRNALNEQLVSYFADTDWIINQKTRFMHDPTLRRSNYFLRRSVQSTERHLQRLGIPITSGKIIADQTFGFWTALFLAHHYRLIGGEPIRIFCHKPTTENRASLYAKLHVLRNFRNRVNHCEPLCFNHARIDCSIARTCKTQLFELLDWIDPDLKGFFESIDNVDNKINSIMAICR